MEVQSPEIGPVSATEYEAADAAVRLLLDGLEVESVRELKRLVDEARAGHAELRDALAEARPYVFQRVLPPGHPEHDWRSETASSVLPRVDAALARARREATKSAES